MSLNDRSLLFLESCDFSWLNALYTGMLHNVLFDHRDRSWVEGELMSLRSKIWEFRIVVENMFVLHCSSKIFTLSFHLFDHAVENLDRIGSFQFGIAGLVEHFIMSMKNPSTMTSWRLSARMHVTVEEISSVLQSL